MIQTIQTHLTRCGAFVAALQGWCRFGFAFAAGAVSALGFAPFSIFPALLFGLAALVLLIDNARNSPRPVLAAAKLGWAFGFGQFLVGLHWIAYSFLVFPGAHEWQLPLLFFFFGGLALFQTAAVAVAAWLWRPGPARYVLFAICYGLGEWLRGHILTGFPWNTSAYAWGASDAILQTAALFGAEGLSLLTVLFGSCLAGLFAAKPDWKPAVILTALFAVSFVGGSIRLAAADEAMTGTRLRLVQPNIPQAEKYSRRFVMRNWSRLLDLSQAPGAPAIIVWPEAAVPFLLDEQPLALEQIGRLAEKSQGLVTGGMRRDYGDGDSAQYANSVFVFGRNGNLVTVYDKSHLVPFGEYLPFEETLSTLGLAKLTGIEGGFLSGRGTKIIALPGSGSFTPLICYEILFPGEVAQKARPAWFVNVTDDSWFGPWAGPRQHLLVARVRAIEQGVPVARAANTGISAIIDPYGRITTSLALNRAGFVDGQLPAAIAATPYSRWSKLLYWVLVCANVALTWGLLKRK